MALSRVVSEIFDVEKYRDLEIRVIGHSSSMSYSSLLVFYRNYAPKTHHFYDFQLQKYRDVENGVRGPSGSLKMSPFDIARITSY